MERAQLDAKRHEANLNALQMEAAEAKRAAAEAQRLQADLKEVQRQLGAWVFEAVENGKANKKSAREAEAAASEANKRADVASAEVRAELGAELDEAREWTQAAATENESLKMRNESLLESLTYFAASRADERSTVRAMRSWQTQASAAQLGETASAYHKAATGVSALHKWEERTRVQRINEETTMLAVEAMGGSLERRALSRWNDNAAAARLDRLGVERAAVEGRQSSVTSRAAREIEEATTAAISHAAIGGANAHMGGKKRYAPVWCHRECPWRRRDGVRPYGDGGAARGLCHPRVSSCRRSGGDAHRQRPAKLGGGGGGRLGDWARR